MPEGPTQIPSVRRHSHGAIPPPWVGVLLVVKPSEMESVAAGMVQWGVYCQYISPTLKTGVASCRETRHETIASPTKISRLRDPAKSPRMFFVLHRKTWRLLGYLLRLLRGPSTFGQSWTEDGVTGANTNLRPLT